MMNTYFFKILEFIGKPIELMVIWVVVPMLEILILLMGVGIFTLILSNIVGVLLYYLNTQKTVLLGLIMVGNS